MKIHRPFIFFCVAASPLFLLIFARPVFAQTWEPVPLVSAAGRAAGHSGGEGAQWPRALVVSASDGKFALFGTDVGGLFRSRNGGKSWEPCNVGYTPRGTSGMAIDPHNARRVLSVGANSVSGDFHGIYLSTDQAASWRQVLKANIGGGQDSREQLAFDPATFDKKIGFTRVVYWSRIASDKPSWGTPDVHPALYKSANGGKTWREIPGTEAVGGSVLKVHPTKGLVYAANGNGLFVSRDGGKTFAKTFDGDVTGLDVTPRSPNAVWVSQADGVYRSNDAGATFVKIAGSAKIAENGFTIRNIHVSPADPKRLVLWREGANYNWKRFFSTDGGATWTESRLDNTFAFLPGNARQGLFAWHPTDPNVVFSVGGDWPTKSGDGGKTFAWSGDGDNGVLVGGFFNFCQQNPDVLFVGSQDYNGAVTHDAGRTWTYVNPSGNGWGGFTYGGYAASKNVLFVGNAAGWGAPRELTVSRDGGKTWNTIKGADDKPLAFAGPDVSFGDPADPNVLFASNLRSADGGKTWTPMTGCDAVYTGVGRYRSFVGVSSVLLGRRFDKEAKQSLLVISTDRGATWITRTTTPGEIRDVALSWDRSRVYAVVDDSLKVWDEAAKTWFTVENLPKDQWGGSRVSSVAVDPEDKNVVYVACHRDLFSTNAAVLRSTDAGKTWTNLTLAKPLDGKNKDGGREAIVVRVHPRTRYAYVATSCYGIWQIGPPTTTAAKARAK